MKVPKRRPGHSDGSDYSGWFSIPMWLNSSSRMSQYVRFVEENSGTFSRNCSTTSGSRSGRTSSKSMGSLQQRGRNKTSLIVASR